jgi:hypothetical protein
MHPPPPKPVGLKTLVPKAAFTALSMIVHEFMTSEEIISCKCEHLNKAFYCCLVKADLWKNFIT